MQKQGTTIQPALTRPPWTPWLVAVLSFLAPPGGAVLTVSNLGRMGAINPEAVGRVAIAVGAIYAVGLAILVAIAAPNVTSTASPSDGASLAITLGTPLASWIVQQPAYRAWRQRYREGTHGSWVRAIVLTLLYTFLIFGGAVFVRLLIAALSGH